MHEYTLFTAAAYLMPASDPPLFTYEVGSTFISLADCGYGFGFADSNDVMSIYTFLFFDSFLDILLPIRVHAAASLT